MTPLRLVFLGSDAIALPLLEFLCAQPVVEVSGVFTQPDRPVGRGQQVQPNAIKRWALARGLPVFQPERLTEEFRQALAALRPDLALVMAYGHILRDDFIATPRLGTLNFHTSLLPNYRGASPIQTAVACGERETGVTLMRIVRRLDAVPIADIEKVPVGALDTAVDVETRLAAACVPLIARALPFLQRGDLPVREQEESAASFCRKLTKEDGFLDFSAPATRLAARINGLFPWPCCSVEVGGHLIKLGLADAEIEGEARGIAAGTVLGDGPDGLRVNCGSGVLRLRRLQRAGGRMLPAADFLRGFPIAAGAVLPSRQMPPLLVTR